MLKQQLVKLYFFLIERIWFLRPIYETYETGSRITLRGLFFQKVLRFNGNVPWPVHFTSLVSNWQYISIGINTAPGISLGNYIFSGKDAPIEIGDYTVIASNVCIGSYNHDLYNISKYTSKGGIKIGRYCWIGANAVVLTGVELGDHTVVAAGAIVTKSFPEGHCVLAGNPARMIKQLDVSKVEKFEHKFKYRGFKKIG